MPINYGSMPFKKAVEFFQDKLSLPTASWTDIWEGQHARAFVVAGAMKEDILNDFRASVDKVIAEGMGLEDFRKDFDKIVAKHGWGYNGSRNWRSRVIYETNLYQAHNAGRYAQMQKVKRTRPYWRYRHNDSVEHPRPEHLAWDGKILLADDPFWDTHYPQNGWGCKCRVETLSERDMKRLGKTGPDNAPAIEYEDKVVGVRGPSPRTVHVPKGIDPGFAYNPGKAAWGKTYSDAIYQTERAYLKAEGKKEWSPMIHTGWREYDRPDRIPFKSYTLPDIDLNKGNAELLEDLLGGKERVFDLHGYPVLINAEFLAAHIPESRRRFIPLIAETINDPYEVWQNFEQHAITGKIALRQRLFTEYKIGKKTLFVVLNVRKGVLTGWTIVDRKASNQGLHETERQGVLIYGK